MALMAAAGEIAPMPQAAIFADTQAEPPSVYRWLDWLEKQLPFPIHRVTAGSLANKSLEMRRSRKGLVFSQTNIPVFTRNVDGSLGKVLHRSCTADFKIKPLLRAARKLCGIKRGQKEVTVTQWIGISWDEVIRMKPARDPWVQNRWPLIEKRLTRAHCLAWMHKHKFPKPPRSACVFCPFHNNDEWRRLKREEPESFAAAVDFERRLQKAKADSDNFQATPYLHRKCLPLDQIDLRTDEERGQLAIWGNECEGMCGV